MMLAKRVAYYRRPPRRRRTQRIHFDAREGLDGPPSRTMTSAALRQQRRPRRVGAEARRRLLQFVPAGDVDGVEVRPRAEVAEEHDDAAVRREGRAFIVEAGREHALARAVRLEDADRELPARLPGEGDVVAARRPHRQTLIHI